MPDFQSDIDTDDMPELETEGEVTHAPAYAPYNGYADEPLGGICRCSDTAGSHDDASPVHCRGLSVEFRTTAMYITTQPDQYNTRIIQCGYGIIPRDPICENSTINFRKIQINLSMRTLLHLSETCSSHTFFLESVQPGVEGQLVG